MKFKSTYHNGLLAFISITATAELTLGLCTANLSIPSGAIFFYSSRFRVVGFLLYGRTQYMLLEGDVAHRFFS